MMDLLYLLTSLHQSNESGAFSNPKWGELMTNMRFSDTFALKAWISDCQQPGDGANTELLGGYTNIYKHMECQVSNLYEPHTVHSMSGCCWA